MPVSAPAHVLAFEEALAEVARVARTLPPVNGVEVVSLLQTRGRVLAEAVRADRDQPPFDRSTRDGFAARAAEMSSGAPLRIAGTLKAGDQWAGALPPGEAIEIMTGAPVPEGAECVAMVEHVIRGAGPGCEAVSGKTMPGGTVAGASGRTWRLGENIVRRGSEAATGEKVLAPGEVVDAAAIALAAACGRADLPVKRRVRVAVVATGDELVEVAAVPEPQQIRNSNSYALAAMVEAAGGEAVRLPITPDRLEAVRESLRQAQSCDLMLLSGGVSMGEYDLVEQALLEAGAEFFWTGVRMQPGKPVVFGRLGDVPFFGLPGNPISTQVCFYCFAEPLLRHLAGAGLEAGPNAGQDAGERVGPRWALARLAEPAERKAGLTRLLPARLQETSVRVVAWQGSGDLTANARANCYVELPEGQGTLAAGEVVRILLR